MNTNIYNPYVKAELELYHHGIAGQRWGKRNGPPYPLGAGDRSASEKKAAAKGTSNSNKNESKNDTQSPKSNKRLSDETKKRIEKGAKIAGAALIAVGAYKIYQSGLMDGAIKTSREKVFNKANAKKVSSKMADFGKKTANKALDGFGDKIIAPMAIGAGSYLMKEYMGRKMDDNMKQEVFRNVNRSKK